MKKTIDIGTKIKDNIAIQYPEIANIHIPKLYSVKAVDYRRDEIEKYHIIFWYRLLKSIYETPTEIECDLYKNINERKTKIKTVSVRKIQGEYSLEVSDAVSEEEIKAGIIAPFPTSWKYFISLPSDGIIELCSMEFNTNFRIAQVILPESSINDSSVEAKKLIDRLLQEANRVGKNLFNPIKEFDEQKNISQYMIFNLYLSTLLSQRFRKEMK